MTIPTLFSTYSVHDYHSYGIHGTGQANGLHFHLAATINAQTGAVLLLNFFFFLLYLSFLYMLLYWFQKISH